MAHRGRGAGVRRPGRLANGIPIVTEETTSFPQALDDLNKCYDVELCLTSHTASVLAMSSMSDGRYAITLQDDLKPGQPGGLTRYTITCDSATGTIEGDPRGGTFLGFVIERPAF